VSPVKYEQCFYIPDYDILHMKVVGDVLSCGFSSHDEKK
jgi:hypothetical protein